MANKAVFLDRDRTLIEDPGYLSDPEGVRLLPGVELAIKSLMQAGYRVVVVTNQSGIARGLLDEETLEKIHAELRRQLADKGAHLDAIYYCPYHPEGTVEAYASDSDLRKPKPGMLLQAAEDVDLDLANSWMVGDSPRDVEAGQRAGCRTVRVRYPGQTLPDGEGDECVQADFTVRNLVDAARVILREPSQAPPRTQGAPAVAAAAQEPRGSEPSEPATVPANAPAGTSPLQPADADEPNADDLADGEVRREILRLLRQYVRRQETEEFSFTKLLGGVTQMLTLMVLLLTFWQLAAGDRAAAQLWATIAVVLQVMSLSFFLMHRESR